MTLDAYRTWAETPLAVPPYLSVVIPAYNETERILPTIGAIASHVSTLGFPWELILADDGSTDDTLALVSDLDLVNLRVLEAAANGGKGSAVRRGVLAARGSLVLFADADQSTPIEQLDRLISVIEDDGYDIAIGSRAADGAEESHKSAARRLLSGGLRLLNERVLRLGVQDSQCGFKLFSRDAADYLFARQRIDGFSFDLEILYLARRAGLSVAEIPVEWIDAPGSTVDAGKVAMRFLVDFGQILANHVIGRYRRPPAERLAAHPHLRDLEVPWTSTSTPQMARRSSD